MFEQKDLIQVKNLQRLLGKAKAELDMQEVLAAGDVLKWVTGLAGLIESDIRRAQEEKRLLSAKMEEEKSTLPSISQEVENIDKNTKKNKK